jgi:tRNA pseudouridine55 synthase
VVDRARRALAERRIGHTGTLDPFATGALALCLGRATRLASYLTAGDKAYEATLRLGFSTTTDDETGEPLGPASTAPVSREALESACARFRGPISQLPPAFSAKKVDGRRLYALARRGESGERRPSQVVVHRLEIVGYEDGRARLDVRCSAGTYVRALARDIGAALGVGGHLTALRRTETSGFSVTGAASWADLEAARRTELHAKCIPMNRLLTHLPAAPVDAAGREAVRHGRAVDPPEALVLDPAGLVRLLGEDGTLLGLARLRDGRLHPHLVLVE